MSTCSTCIYLGHEQPGAREAVTVCRRNAPGAKGWPRIVWPEADWCGQYKSKTERGQCRDCKHWSIMGMTSIDGKGECHEQPRPIVFPDDKRIVTFPPVYDIDSCSRWEQMP